MAAVATIHPARKGKTMDVADYEVGDSGRFFLSAQQAYDFAKQDGSPILVWWEDDEGGVAA